MTNDRQTLETVLEKAGWIALTNHTLLEATGSDATRYLQGQLTNDVKLATTARAVRAFICTAKGQVEGQFFVHRTPADSLRLSCPTEQAEDLQMRLDKYIIADDVELADITADFAQFHMMGPRAQELTEHLSFNAAQIIENPRFRLNGFDIIVPAVSAPLVREKLAENAPEISPAAEEVLRIRQGIPGWQEELAQGVLPAESGLLQETVSFTKGCYIGQEVISRMKSAGKVRRALVRLQTTEKGLQPGQELFDIKSESGKAIGNITSATVDPVSGKEIGLGFVRDGFQNPGHALIARLSPADPAVNVTVVKRA